jgi:quercetin dioxygenase-like cupin family protein
MRNRSLSFVTLVLLCIPSLSASAQAPALAWGPAPAVFPAGARMAVLHGNPGKPELFTVRLDFPNGYTIPPHFHPTDENVTVISGSLRLGMGDKVDVAHMTTLPAGGFITAGANMHHWARANGHTVVQVHAIGPFALTYVNAADDPSKKAAKK